jgi:hypothetical protein
MLAELYVLAVISDGAGLAICLGATEIAVAPVHDWRVAFGTLLALAGLV